MVKNTTKRDIRRGSPEILDSHFVRELFWFNISLLYHYYALICIFGSVYWLILLAIFITIRHYSDLIKPVKALYARFIRSAFSPFFFATFFFFYHYYALSCIFGFSLPFSTHWGVGFHHIVYYLNSMFYPWKFLMFVYVFYVSGMLVCKLNAKSKPKLVIGEYWDSFLVKCNLKICKGSEDKLGLFMADILDIASKKYFWWNKKMGLDFLFHREVAIQDKQRESNLPFFFFFRRLFFKDINNVWIASIATRCFFLCLSFLFFFIYHYYALSCVFDNSTHYTVPFVVDSLRPDQVWVFSHGDILGQAGGIFGLDSFLTLEAHTTNLHRADYFFYYCNFGATCLFILMLLRWWCWRNKSVANFEFLLVSFNVFMVLFFLSFNLVIAFACLEGFSFALYALAAFNARSHRSVESAIKYFCLGSVSSGLFLYGISLLYGLVGSSNFYEIRQYLTVFIDSDIQGYVVNPPFILYLSAYLVIFGFLFKLSAFPCHIWTPDVYEGALGPVTAIFAISAKFGVFLFFLKFLLITFFNVPNLLNTLFLFSALGSLVVGCFGALVQKKIKRFVAYTSINQVGFLLMGLSCGTLYGFCASFLHLQIYYIMGIAFFTFVLSFSIYECSPNSIKKGGREMVYLSDLTGLGKYDISISPIFITIVLFSMAGVPPLGGFFSKYFILVAVSESSNYSLVIVGLFVNVVSAFYYIKIISRIWFTGPYVRQETAAVSLGVVETFLLINCTFFLLVVPFFLEELTQLAFEFMLVHFKIGHFNLYFSGLI